MTLGLGNDEANVEPGKGSRYGGGGEARCFTDVDDTRISSGVSIAISLS